MHTWHLAYLLCDVLQPYIIPLLKFGSSQSNLFHQHASCAAHQGAERRKGDQSVAKRNETNYWQTGFFILFSPSWFYYSHVAKHDSLKYPYHRNTSYSGLRAMRIKPRTKLCIQMRDVLDKYTQQAWIIFTWVLRLLEKWKSFKSSAALTSLLLFYIINGTFGPLKRFIIAHLTNTKRCLLLRRKPLGTSEETARFISNKG